MEQKKKMPLNTIIGIMLKSTKLVKMLKAVKVIKSAKYLVTAFTMLLSALVYGWRFGFWFGAGLVALIFIHEMGHVWAMKRKGYPTSAPIFIPLLGAVIFAPPMDDRDEESYIGFGGPFIGTLGALVLWGLWYILPSHPTLLLLLSYFGIYINLFNLLPIRPLDGGRILQSVGPWFKWIGLVMLCVVLYMMQHPGLLLIFMLSVDDFVPNRKTRFRYMAVIFVLMMVGYIIGPGFSMEFWVDLPLGLLLLGMAYGSYRIRLKKGEDLTEVASDARPYPSIDIKRKWLIRYFLLLISLIVLIVIMHGQIEPLLPKK